MLDNRRAARQPCYLGCKIIYNRGLWSEECIVRNVSTAGARLKVADPRTLPDRFRLSVPARDIDCSALIKWREDHQIGVVFETDAPEGVIEFSAARLQRQRGGAKNPRT